MLLLLVAGIGLATYLVQNQTHVLPFAADGDKKQIQPYLIWPKDHDAYSQYEPAINKYLTTTLVDIYAKAGVKPNLLPLKVIKSSKTMDVLRCGNTPSADCIGNKGKHDVQAEQYLAEVGNSDNIALIFAPGMGGFAGSNVTPTRYSMVADWVLEPLSGTANSWGWPCSNATDISCSKDWMTGTVAHELGHAMGIDGHTGVSVMNQPSDYSKGFLASEVTYLQSSPYVTVTGSSTPTGGNDLKSTRTTEYQAATTEEACNQVKITEYCNNGKWVKDVPTWKDSCGGVLTVVRDCTAAEGGTTPPAQSKTINTYPIVRSEDAAKYKYNEAGITQYTGTGEAGVFCDGSNLKGIKKEGGAPSRENLAECGTDLCGVGKDGKYGCFPASAKGTGTPTTVTPPSGATNPTSPTTPGSSDADKAKLYEKCGFKQSENGVPMYAVKIGEDQNISDPDCQKLIGDQAKYFQQNIDAARKLAAELAAKEGGITYDGETDTFVADDPAKQARADELNNKIAAPIKAAKDANQKCKDKTGQDQANCLKDAQEPIQTAATEAQKANSGAQLDKLKKILAGDLGGKDEMCVKADLGVTPFMDAQGVGGAHQGEEYRLLVCRGKGDTAKIKWRVLLLDSSNGDCTTKPEDPAPTTTVLGPMTQAVLGIMAAVGPGAPNPAQGPGTAAPSTKKPAEPCEQVTGSTEVSGKSERLKAFYPVGHETGEPDFSTPLKVNTCVTIDSNDPKVVEEKILAPYIAAAGKSGSVPGCTRIHNPNDTGGNGSDKGPMDKNGHRIPSSGGATTPSTGGGSTPSTGGGSTPQDPIQNPGSGGTGAKCNPKSCSEKEGPNFSCVDDKCTYTGTKCNADNCKSPKVCRDSGQCVDPYTPLHPKP